MNQSPVATVVKLGDRPFDPSIHTLIFTHIPKCGGTSLHSTFAHLLGEAHYRVFTTDPNDRANLDGLRGGGGHQRFANNVLHSGERQLVYVTVLREPMDRFRSFFHHVRRPGHPLQQRNPDIARMAPRQLIDYLEEIGNASASNLAAHMLAPKAKTAWEVIEHVERNYSLVSILENMTGFFEELTKMFPGLPIKTFQLNRTSDYLDPIPLDNPLLIERVRQINELDYALYEHFRRKSERVAALETSISRGVP